MKVAQSALTNKKHSTAAIAARKGQLRSTAAFTLGCELEQNVEPKSCRRYFLARKTAVNTHDKCCRVNGIVRHNWDSNPVLLPSWEKLTTSSCAFCRAYSAAPAMFTTAMPRPCARNRAWYGWRPLAGLPHTGSDTTQPRQRNVSLKGAVTCWHACLGPCGDWILAPGSRSLPLPCARIELGAPGGRWPG